MKKNVLLFFKIYGRNTITNTTNEIGFENEMFEWQVKQSLDDFEQYKKLVELKYKEIFSNKYQLLGFDNITVSLINIVIVDSLIDN